MSSSLLRGTREIGERIYGESGPAGTTTSSQPGATRRDFLRQAIGLTASMSGVASQSAFAAEAWSAATGRRPNPTDRKFNSKAVEEFLTKTGRLIADPVLRSLFVNCFPNTLDTTVLPGTFDGKPDTAVITGDIPAMWLRDSSAQIWPYLPLAASDEPLRRLLEGVIRRQTRCLLIDPYANSFMSDLSAAPLEWSRKDRTEMKQGVGERKYELDFVVLSHPTCPRLLEGHRRCVSFRQPLERGNVVGPGHDASSAA